MQIRRAELRKLVVGSYPNDGYWMSVFLALHESFRIADVFTKRYRKSERKSVFGHMRRAEFETAWQDVSRQIPGVEVNVESNSNGGADHAVISMGDLVRLVLTESAVDKPGDFPQDALFRRNLALRSQSDWLDPVSNDVPPITMVYGILSYGPRRASRPYFASIIIPDATGTSVYDRLDLTPQLRAAVAAAQALEEEHRMTTDGNDDIIGDDLQIGLTPAAKEEQARKRHEEEMRRRRLKRADGDGEIKP